MRAANDAEPHPEPAGLADAASPESPEAKPASPPDRADAATTLDAAGDAAISRPTGEEAPSGNSSDPVVNPAQSVQILAQDLPLVDSAARSIRLATVHEPQPSAAPLTAAPAGNIPQPLITQSVVPTVDATVSTVVEPVASSHSDVTSVAPEPTANPQHHATPVTSDPHPAQQQPLTEKKGENRAGPAMRPTVSETPSRPVQSPLETTGGETRREGASPDSGGLKQSHSPPRGFDQASSPSNIPAVALANKVDATVQLHNLAAGRIADRGAPVVLGPNAAPVSTSVGGSTVELPTSGSESALTTGRSFAGGIVRGMSTMLNHNGGVMTMRLDPPTLGDMRVQMSIIRGVVTASFQATTAEARQLLNQHLATLRAGLESQGLSVEKLTVHSPPSSVNASDSARDAGSEDDAEARPDAGQGRSRGHRERQEQARHEFDTPRGFAERIFRFTPTDHEEVAS